MAETHTSQYEFAHGRKPRGYGNWAIRVVGTDGKGKYTSSKYFCLGKLADAKRQAGMNLKAECGAVKYIVEYEILP